MVHPQGSNPRPPGMLGAALIIFIVGIVVVYGALNALQLPDPITEQAERTKKLYLATLAISMIVYFGVTAGIIWAIFRYRRRSADEMPVQIHGSNILEFTWTAIPILILVGLFIPSLILVLDLKTQPPEGEVDVEVEAIGHQWWWEFNYPEDGVRVQQTPPNYEDFSPPALVVPVGQVVHISVRSTDVVHSFSAPQTLYKIQAIPGNVNEMHFKVEKEGVYPGQCYQFCGLRHSNMLFVLDARSPEDYERWVQEERAKQNSTSPDNSAITIDSLQNTGIKQD